MAILNAQSVVSGFTSPTQLKTRSSISENNSQGSLFNQISLKTSFTLSTGFSNSNQANLSANYSKIESSGYFQDYLSSFAGFFGVRATQDVTKIYIYKSDLPRLTPLLSNTAESLLTALLLQIKQHESNSLISSVFVDLFNQRFEIVRNQPSLLSVLVINLYIKIIYSDSLDPAQNNQMLNYYTPITPNSFN